MSSSDHTEETVGGSFPARVGPCRLLKPIGSGATGTVFLAEVAEDAAWGRVGDRVAMKLLHPELTRGSRALRRFLREGSVGHGIRHPGVVRTHAAGSADADGSTWHFIVQEHVDGTTLGELIRQWGVIPEPMLRSLGAQLAHGIAAIHAAGAVHRDLKPENVLLTSRHEVKIADLGIARLFDDEASLTATGDFVGTPHHAAPEQFEGGSIGPEADLYALGVLLYEAATGRLPFVSADRHGLRRLHVGHVPPPASTLNPQISPLLDDLVALLLEKSPSARPRPASRVAEILEVGEESAWWRDRRASRRARARPSHARRARHPAPLTGRTEEMRALRSLLVGDVAPHPRFLLVEADAGMGKTRLADELVTEAERLGAIVLWGGNAPSPAGAARGAVAQSILEHFGSDDLEARLASVLGPSRRLARALASSLLGGPAAASSRSPREDVTAAIAALLASMARESRVAWVLEDLHYAPPGEIALLASIVSAIDAGSIAVLATTRPGLLQADRAALAALPGYEARTLARLEATHVRELLAHAAPALPASSRLAASLARRTDGVPYFLFELLRSLGSGALEIGGLEAEAKPGVPASLQHLLLARIEGIGLDDREILDAAAIVGAELDPALVARVLGRDLLDVLRAFARLERTHGVVRGVGERVAFDHHLLHEVVRDAMLPALRRELHGRVADVMESARHAEGAGVTGDEAALIVAHRVGAGQLARACEHGLAAMEWLARSGRQAEVADLAPRLLEGADPRDVALRARLSAACVQALGILGRCDEARRMAEEGLPLATAAGEKGASIDLALHLASDARDRGDATAADEWHARALAVAESACDDSRTASVLMSRGLQRMLAGRREEARADYGRASECATRAGEIALAAAALGQVATAWSHQGDHERSHALLLEAHRMAASAEPAQHPGSFLVTLAQSHVLRGELDAARIVGTECLALAREFGRRPLEAQMLSGLCDVEMAAGNLQDARSLASRSVALRRAIGGKRHDALAHLALALISRLEGDLDTAEESLSAVIEHSSATATPLYAGNAHKMLGEVARARGDVAEAQARFGEAAALLEASGNSWGVVDSLMRRARAEIEGGLMVAAHATLDDALRRQAAYEDTEEKSVFDVWRVIAGHAVRDLDGIPEPIQLHEAADMHLALHVAGHPGDHLARARRMLEHLSRHLHGPALERFWQFNVTARRLRALG